MIPEGWKSELKSWNKFPDGWESEFTKVAKLITLPHEFIENYRSEPNTNLLACWQEYFFPTSKKKGIPHTTITRKEYQQSSLRIGRNTHEVPIEGSSLRWPGHIT